MTASPLRAFTGVISACSSAKLSTPVPLSLVTAMADWIAVRLVVLTPVRPKAWSCSRVGAVPPAAASTTTLTAEAITCSSATELTSPTPRRSITLLSSAALAVRAPSVLVPPKLSPIAVNCEAVSAVALLEPPSARAMTARAASATVCTSAAESVAVLVRPATALMSSGRAALRTPVTPAAVKSASVGASLEPS